MRVQVDAEDFLLVCPAARAESDKTSHGYRSRITAAHNRQGVARTADKHWRAEPRLPGSRPIESRCHRPAGSQSHGAGVLMTECRA